MADSGFVNGAEVLAELAARTHGEAYRPLAVLLWHAALAGHTALPHAQVPPELLKGLEEAPRGGFMVSAFGHVYLQRFAQLESRIAQHLWGLTRAHYPISPATLAAAHAVAPTANAEQRAALQHALRHRLLLLSGGPGTGKSFTLGAVIAALRATTPGLKIAAAAPTAQAAQRLKTFSLNAQPDWIGTVHRLLGESPAVIAHARDEKLAWEVVIVDEASMLSAEMADRLLARLRPDARLILSGDQHQLASVEAGEFFAQACTLHEALVTLRESKRFSASGSLVGMLAQAVLSGQLSAELLDRLSAETARVEWTASAVAAKAAQQYVRALQAHGLAGARQFRLLSALNVGPLGVERLNAQIESLVRQMMAPGGGEWRNGEQWFEGKLIVVTRNDAVTGLSNGQVGMAVRGEQGQWLVQFERAEGTATGNQVQWPIDVLPAIQPAWALTVHKAQGQEYDEVMVVLPTQDSPLAQRELLYTAVTRAREHIQLVGSEAQLLACIERPAIRYSGLGERLKALESDPLRAV